MPENAEIIVEGADHLYREIRIENTLEDAQGKKVKLKEGAEVDFTIEVDPKDTAPKETSSKQARFPAASLEWLTAPDGCIAAAGSTALPGFRAVP